MPREPGLRVFLLGALRLVRDGRTIRLTTRKTDALLTYLLLYPEPHTREKLAAFFWGESPVAPLDREAKHTCTAADAEDLAAAAEAAAQLQDLLIALKETN